MFVIWGMLFTVDDFIVYVCDIGNAHLFNIDELQEYVQNLFVGPLGIVGVVLLGLHFKGIIYLQLIYLEVKKCQRF